MIGGGRASEIDDRARSLWRLESQFVRCRIMDASIFGMAALVDCGVLLCAGVGAPTTLQSHCICHQRDDAVLSVATNWRF